MSDNESKFGEKLKELRKQKNLSQGKLAKLLGVHPTHISRYERGIIHPTSRLLQKLAEVLDVSADSLLEGPQKDLVRSRIEDKDLIDRFEQIKELSDEDKKVVTQFLDAFIMKKKMSQYFEKEKEVSR